MEQIEALWAKDAKIDVTDLTQDSAAQLELHQKYHKILNYVKRELRKTQAERTRLIGLKHDYYTNTMAPQQIKDLGWEPNRKLHLKEDLKRVIEQDEDVIEINLRIGDINDMVEFLDSIIRAIYQKPFVTKNIIENQKFMQGEF